MFDIEFEKVEASVQHGVEWLRLAIETLGAMVIAVGIAVAVLGIIRHFFVHRGHGFTDIRLAFARYLTLALELQLAADVLSTSIAPTWAGPGIADRERARRQGQEDAGGDGGEGP